MLVIAYHQEAVAGHQEAPYLWCVLSLEQGVHSREEC